MKATELFKKLGMHIGTRPLKLDANGLCCLLLDDLINLNIQLAREGTYLHLYTVVAQRPQVDSQALITALLKANLFGYALDGSCFGLSEEKIFLHKRIFLTGLEFEAFVQELEVFLHHAERWIQNLQTFYQAAGWPASSPDELRKNIGHPESVRQSLRNQDFLAVAASV